MMRELTVTNVHSAAVERGGKVFPPRSTTTVVVQSHRVPEIKAARKLTVEEVERSDEPEPEVVIDEDGEEVEPEADYSHLTNSQLRDMLAELGLSTAGTKSELIERIKAQN